MVSSYVNFLHSLLLQGQKEHENNFLGGCVTFLLKPNSITHQIITVLSYPGLRDQNPKQNIDLKNSTFYENNNALYLI